MLIVKNKGQTEGFLHNDGSLEVKEEVNGAFTLSASATKTAENIGFDLLDGGAVISWQGYDFRVRQFGKSDYTKSFTGYSTYFDNKGERKKEIFGGTHTLNEFLDFTLAGTGWTYENVDVTGSKLIPNFGDANVLKLVEILLSTFEAERQIMPNQHLVFKKQLGPDRDAQYRYGHNVKAVNYSYDDTEVFTSIEGQGGGGLVVKYTSPNADKFPAAGEAEPFKDDRFTVAENLLAQLKLELNDEPVVAIELEALELYKRELGERVWLFHEPIDVTMKTRILAKVTREPEERSTVVIGNAIPKTQGDQLADQKVEIDENAKQTESKFEQTNEKITAEVTRINGEVTEAYTRIEQTADNIRQEAAVSKLEIEADLEAGLAAGLVESISYIDQTALAINAGINTSIEYLDGRVEEAETQVNMIAGQITTAVSSMTEYTDTKINLINSTIEGLETDLGGLGEDITGVGGRVDLAVDNIGTLQSDLATLDGEIITVRQEASSQFDILSGAITAGVSTTRTYAEQVAGQAKTDAVDDAETYVDGKITTVVATATANFDILSGRINAKAENSVVTNLGTRVTSVQQSLNAIDGEISNIVSFTDVSGDQIISKVNQTASSWKVSAKNIQLDGITEVAANLKIGASSDGIKSIWFNNNSALDTFPNTLSMQMSTSGAMYLTATEVRFDNYYSTARTTVVDLSTAKSIKWGDNAPSVVGKFG